MLLSKYKILSIEEVDEISTIGYKIGVTYLYKIKLDPMPPLYPIYICKGKDTGYILKGSKIGEYLIVGTNTNWSSAQYLNNDHIHNSCSDIKYFRQQLWIELGSLDNPDLQTIDWYIASINNLN